MPTYEYICKQCGHLFEIVQSMRDDPLTECPECGGVLRKVFAPPAISFKGSGFYATDHGKKSKKPGDKAGTKEKSDSKTGSSTDSSAAASSAGSSTTKDGGSGSSSTSKKEGSAGPKEKSSS